MAKPSRDRELINLSPLFLLDGDSIPFILYSLVGSGQEAAHINLSYPQPN
jgi:hypothetical protein